MPFASAVARASRAKTWVWMATLGTPASSSAIANPTTVGLQVLQSPTPRMAALPSATTFGAHSGSSTQLSRGLMMRVIDRGQVLGEPVPHLLHEGFGVVEQAVDEIDDLAVQARVPRAPGACP